MASRAGREATHGVTVRKDLRVETRDGVGLATDVYRPAAPDGTALAEPRPALLVRTPYDKDARKRVENHGEFYARRGYVVAIQDCRGRYASEGEFTLLRGEAEDGADTVAWLADRPYCDGQVGTMGTSYSAWVQNALASLDPDGLAAMFVNQGAADAWDATLRQGGAFELRWLTWALTIGGGFARRALDDPDVQRALARVDTAAVLERWPVERGQSPLALVPGYEDWVFELLTAAGDDELWASPSLDFAGHYEAAADVPTVYAGSWYDSYAAATCANYEALSGLKTADHYLLMGAWIHGGAGSWATDHAGEVAFGDAHPRPYLDLRLDFFDHYLRGTDDWADQPPVEYFRMGGGDGGRTGDGRLRYGGEWRRASEWPPADTERTRLFATPEGGLGRDRPTEPAATTYRYDPADPVPTLGGNCSSYVRFEERAESIEAYPLRDRPTHSITGQGGFDQRTRPETTAAEPPYGPLAERADVVVFRTPPLAEPLEIVGRPTVTLHAATDGPDTDFTAKLVHEHPPSAAFPDGFALNLCDSIRRLRYRDDRREPAPATPGETYELTIEPYPTATRLAAGDRLRLDLSSSNFPRYDPNPNTGGPTTDRERRVATNTVHHGGDHPTALDLSLRRPDGGEIGRLGG